MLQQKNSASWVKLNGLLRYVLMHTATRTFPLYVVNEYPKSGGSWVGEMLSDALEIPFPRNRLPMLQASILQGHVMQSWNMHNVVLVWRDGRDVLISQYYHWLFENDRGNARLVAQCRADLQFADYSDVTANLVPFMAYVFENKRYPRMSWKEFADRWAGNQQCVHVWYEKLRAEPTEELCRIVRELTGRDIDQDQARQIVASQSFEKISGRRAGIENKSSFMRKGIVGDWKNHFNQDARERFFAYAGDVLIRLGYEKDDSWVRQVGSESTF